MGSAAARGSRRATGGATAGRGGFGPRGFDLITDEEIFEDYEVAVPFYALAGLGVAVHCAPPGKAPRDPCPTAVHDFLGDELYTELPGHRFRVTADFAAAAADPSSYDALIVPGGRFVEQLSIDPEAVALVGAFAGELRRPVVLTCHSQALLAAAGAMGGVRCTAFFSLRPLAELAGRTWVEPDPFGLCVADGHVVTAIVRLLCAMGARVHGGRGQGVLFLYADYVDDYEENVPFRALDAVGCRVEAACPTKRKGEACVTAIYEDFAGAAPDTVSDEKHEHNVVMTVDWADIDVDDYECVVVPGGRSPELLVTKGEAVAKFAAKGKVVGSIDQGHLVLAAAGLLKGKRCMGRVPMRVISNLTGAVGVEPEGAGADGKLVTAASWPDLAEFIAHLVDLLGITVSF